MSKEIDFYGGTNPILHFNVHTKQGKRLVLQLEVQHLIHGGRSGKDPEEVAKHVIDLESYGVKHKYPPLGPVAFLLPTFNATTSKRVEVYDNANNAEVEYVLLVDDRGKIYVTVGSDHTDREMEGSAGPPKAKLLAPKVMSSEAWLYEELNDHWDELVLRLYGYPSGSKELYMEGKAGTLRHPDDLMQDTHAQAGLKDLKNSVIFGGTLPSLTGGFMWGSAWDLELYDPVLTRTISHHYEVEVVWHRVPPYPTKERPPDM